MAATALVDDLSPSHQQALSILQRSESTPLTDDEKRQYQQEVLNILSNTTTANDFVEECKIMARAALDVDIAFDNVQATLNFWSMFFTYFIIPLALLWAQMRKASE